MEAFAFILIIEYNFYQREIFINTSNNFTNQTKKISGRIYAYFHLKKENEILSHQNIHLLNFLSRQNKQPYGNNLLPYAGNRFQYLPGLILNNSTKFEKNLMTIDKGKIDGIKPNMGVIGPNGVVGVVYKSSSHFSTVVPLINTTLKLNVALKKNNFSGTLEWDGKDYTESKIWDIPTHVKINKGDTIVTSGFSAIFPPGIPVGYVSGIDTVKSTNFYNLTIKLFTNFRTIRHIYIVQNIRQEEQILLEQESRRDNEQ